MTDHEYEWTWAAPFRFVMTYDFSRALPFYPIAHEKAALWSRRPCEIPAHAAGEWRRMIGSAKCDSDLTAVDARCRCLLRGQLHRAGSLPATGRGRLVAIAPRTRPP